MVRMQQDYLVNFHEADIIHILRHEDILNHFAININFIVLYEHRPELALELLREPEECLEAWDQAVLKVQVQLLKKGEPEFNIKKNVHCRVYHMPGLPDVCRIFFPNNDDAGKFVQVSGTVMSMTSIKLLQYQRSYICVKCKYHTLVTAEYEKKYIIKQPKKCGNPENCPSTNLVQLGDLDSEYCKDFQQIKIQEQIKKLGVGSMPNTMWVTLEDDLVDTCKPGDNVTICGIVKRRWGEFSKGSKIEIDIVLKANNVQVDSNSNSTTPAAELQETFTIFWNNYSENPLGGRDLILKSFCPEIYGLYLVKLAVATVLAGGCQIEDTMFTGVSTRSESHLLLVGDPGTGKSQLLRFVSKIIPRSVLTTGVGSTAAGLTVAAIMEHGEWQLEGGALVMADGGVCCIDEFNSMKEHDRTSIHEAMEQQTISVAKASIVCKLNTRCSILAACNPKGNLDPSNPLCMNIALPSPLLSRFDLILLLRDTVNMQWDSDIADYILNGKNSYSKLTDSKLWTIDILQSYFITIRKINPKLTENAEMILSRYYQMQRKIDNRNKARTTIRLLESLIRISQGHARLMFHREVEVIDSIYAVVLVDIAMDVSSIFNLNINTRSIFPDCPLSDYHSLLENVLNKLDLQDIFQQEVGLLRKNKTNMSGNRMSRFFSSHEEKVNGAPSSEVTVLVSPIQNQQELACNDHEKKRKNSDNTSEPEKMKRTRVLTNGVSPEENCTMMIDSMSMTQEQNVPLQGLQEFASNDQETKRKETVGKASESNEKIKSIGVLTDDDLDVTFNENCSVIGSMTTKQGQNEESKGHELEHLQNGASTKYLKPTKNTSESDIIVNYDKNKILDRDKLIEEVNKGCIILESNDSMKNREKQHKNKKDKNNFLKDDLDMLMLMPDVSDNFNIHLDIDL